MKKNAKRFLALLLALVMMCSSSVSALAGSADTATATDAEEPVEVLTETSGEIALESAADTEEIVYISSGETVNVTIDTAGGYSYLYFVPEVTGGYIFYSGDTELDTYGYLTDSDGTELTCNDDGGSGWNYQLSWNCTAGETYIIKSRFYSSDVTGSFSVTVEEVDNTTLYWGTSYTYFIGEGDSFTMEAGGYTFLYDEVDYSTGNYTFEWTRIEWYEYEDGTYEISTSEILGTEETYTIDPVTETDFYNSYLLIYNRYECSIYLNGEYVATTYHYLKNVDYYYTSEARDYEVLLNDTVTLTAFSYDYNGNRADLTDGAFTFEWYKIYDYYDETIEEEVYYSSEVLGTEFSLVIDEAQTTDFYDSENEQWNHYICYIFKNGIRVAGFWAYVYETDPITISSQPVNAAAFEVGESVTVSVSACAYDDGELFYSWYGQEPDSEGFAELGIYTSSATVTMTEELDGMQMYCVVTDAAGNSVTTKTVTLTIREKVYLTLGETVSAAMETGGDYAWFFFEPTASGYYKITTMADGYQYPITSLMDADREDVLTDSWGSGSYILYYCRAGETYVLRTYFEDSEDTGEVTILLETFDASAPYYVSSGNYYAEEGDSLTLEATVYDFYGNSVETDGETYTFEWVKIYNYYNDNGVYVYYTSEVLGTESTLVLNEVEASDFYCDGKDCWNQYLCTVYENGEYAFCCYVAIFDKNYTYRSRTRYPSGVEGRTITLEAVTYDYNYGTVDLTDDAFTFEWYKVLDYYDADLDDWYYSSVKLDATGLSYETEELTALDLYDSSDSNYSYYYCRIYKDGIYVATCRFYISETEPIAINTQPQNATVFAAGQSATLTVSAEAFDGGELTYSWYYRNSEDEEFAEAGIYTAEATVTVTAANDGREMYCVITDAYGYCVATNTVTLAVMEKSYIELDETKEVTIGQAGGYNYLVFVPEESGYYRFWSSNDEGYDTYGNLLDTDGNLLASNDDGGDGNNFSMVYYCTAGESYIICSEFYYDEDCGSFSVTVNAFDENAAYHGDGWEIYTMEGDTVEMTAGAWNYFYDNYVDLTDGTYSFEWYSFTRYYDEESGSWISETSDVICEEQTYTIESVSTSDFYYVSGVDAYHYLYCRIYRNGVYACTTYVYICNAEGLYWSATDYPEAAEGDSLLLEAKAYDYMGNEIDLTDGTYTFEWYRIIDAYDSVNDTWIWDKSDILGTDATYEISALESDDFCDLDNDIYNRYVCYIYKDGERKTYTYVYITEVEAIEITSQPEDITGYIGDTVTFTVAAVGEGLSYQWQYSTDGGLTWVNSAWKQAYCQVTVAEKRDGYLYRCVLTDADGHTRTTNAAMLTVGKFEIISQPEDTTAYVGDTVTFTVAATGKDVSYQWQYSTNGGKTWTNSAWKQEYCEVTAAEKRSGYLYRCVVTDANGDTLTSQEAMLTVNTLVISVQPESIEAYEGDTVRFTVEATGTDLTYQWQYSLDSGKTWTNSAWKKDYCEVTATAKRNGYLYRCVLTEANGNTQTTDAAELTVNVLTVTVQPVDITALAGEKVTFATEATGKEVSYQWQLSTDGGATWSNSAWKTEICEVTATEKRNGYRYRCVITDANGNTLTTDEVTLTVNTLVITSQPADIAAYDGDTVYFTIGATGTGLSYQWQYSIDGGETWTDSAWKTDSCRVNAAVKRNGYLYRCVVTEENGNTLISETAVLTVEALAITSQPMDVAALIGETATFTVEATGKEVSYQWQYSTDGGTTWANSAWKVNKCEVTATEKRNGYLYRCIVTDANGNTLTSETAKLTTGAVVITLQPEDTAAGVGDTVIFTVAARGTDLTYQWQYSTDGGTTWANSAWKQETCQVTATEKRNGYLYRCIVTDVDGNTATSDIATLTVNK